MRRAFTVWAAAWFVVGLIVLVYGSIRWAGDPVGREGNIFFAIVAVIQPLITGLWWVCHVWEPIREIREWVRDG